MRVPGLAAQRLGRAGGKALIPRLAAGRRLGAGSPGCLLSEGSRELICRVRGLGSLGGQEAERGSPLSLGPGPCRVLASRPLPAQRSLVAEWETPGPGPRGQADLAKGMKRSLSLTPGGWYLLWEACRRPWRDSSAPCPAAPGPGFAISPRRLPPASSSPLPSAEWSQGPGHRTGCLPRQPSFGSHGPPSRNRLTAMDQCDFARPSLQPGL